MAYSLDPHVAQFFTVDVCAAAGITPATLVNWIGKQPPAIVMGADDRPGTSGRSHLFSFQRAMQIALTAKLVSSGTGSPRRAGMLAATFTDMSSGFEDNADGTRREPGELFRTGYTVLVAYPGEDHATILNMIEDKTPMRNIFFPIESATRHQPAATIVLVDLIYQQVRAALYK